MARPAPTAPARLSTRPRTAAVGARNRRLGPAREAPLTRPTTGERSTTARPATAPARPQVRVDTARTGTPSRLARAELSAAARVATPRSVRLRNAQTSPT